MAITLTVSSIKWYVDGQLYETQAPWWVAGMLTGNRALDFSGNGTHQPGRPGPLAAGTNASLGFGVVSNFVAALRYGANVLLDQRSDTNAASLLSNTPAAANVNFGASAACVHGNPSRSATILPRQTSVIMRPQHDPSLGSVFHWLVLTGPVSCSRL